MHHDTFGTLNLLSLYSTSSDSRQFLEKCFAHSGEETPSHQFLLSIVLAILAIASITAYKQAPHISRSLQQAGTHAVQELLWINSR
ncbi:hypothetical protein [Gloeocapsopsis crepidinum]|nr:hypothetical protein [Gloeocapsopsis crepidinum]